MEMKGAPAGGNQFVGLETSRYIYIYCIYQQRLLSLQANLFVGMINKSRRLQQLQNRQKSLLGPGTESPFALKKSFMRLNIDSYHLHKGKHTYDFQ